MLSLHLIFHNSCHHHKQFHYVCVWPLWQSGFKVYLLNNGRMYVLVQKPTVSYWSQPCISHWVVLPLLAQWKQVIDEIKTPSVSHHQTHMHPFSFIPSISKNSFFLLFRAIYLLVLFVWSLPLSFKTLLLQLHALPFNCHLLHRSYTGKNPSHLKEKFLRNEYVRLLNPIFSSCYSAFLLSNFFQKATHLSLLSHTPSY